MIGMFGPGGVARQPLDATLKCSVCLKSVTVRCEDARDKMEQEAEEGAHIWECPVCVRAYLSKIGYAK